MNSAYRVCLKCSHTYSNCLLYCYCPPSIQSCESHGCRFRTYHSVPYIHPQFCNLSTSQMCRGAYMGDLTFYVVNTPPLPVPRLDVYIRMHYRPIEAGSTPVCLCFFRPPETRIPCGQDRLTEVGHSIDGSVFQALCGFFLSMCCNIAVR